MNNSVVGSEHITSFLRREYGVICSDLITPSKIMNIVSDVTGISVSEIKRKTRKKEIVQIRQIYHTICLYTLDNTIVEIALTTLHDRNSVTHSARVVHAAYQIEPSFRSIVDSILDKMGRDDLKSVLLKPYKSKYER